MSNTNNRDAAFVFYTPPTTPEGLRDYRSEITRWKNDHARHNTLCRYPIDALIIIDNLLDALDVERLAALDKEREASQATGNMRDQHDALVGRLKQNLWASKGRTA